MILEYSRIADIALGAHNVEIKKDGVVFHRLSPRQELLYKERTSSFYEKARSSSGIVLRFRTDSESIAFKVRVARGSSRKYFSFDLFVNGTFKKSFNNFEGADLSGDYTKIQLPLGEFSFGADLEKGEKEVALYFPWSVRVTLAELSLSDGAFVVPIKPERKMLMLGDSITQGYDALYPSRKYSTRLAEYFSAEERNLAIGAELFFPPLVSESDGEEPDIITVAYGTNDWFFGTLAEFKGNCKAFFEALSKSYPEAEIIALTPIWRKDMNDTDKAGDFREIGEYIKAVIKTIPNAKAVDCFDLVPRDTALFADLMLHPNDQGFDHYIENLLKSIKTAESEFSGAILV
ncbi:MAG: hypothetical protein IKL24_06200 [Clostridia bacterium]|nr:hypothetical protein [Clostridia bacterium]